jgi:ubiquitin C-terminal hydrolase
MREYITLLVLIILLIFFFKKIFFYCSWWMHSSDLASYEQQDAHEFFISILDRIHDNLVQDQQNSNKNGIHYLVLNI